MSENVLRISKPLALHQIGGRDNNEDAIYPPVGLATDADRLFLVCDGVGGLDKGEVASAQLCEHVAHYLRSRSGQQPDKQLIEDAVRFAEEQMAIYAQHNPSCAKMSSTMTLLLLENERCTVAWAGDSRVYQLREGKIQFCTKDHSLVQWLIDSGEITAEQAAEHPMRNMILRSIGAADHTAPSVEFITDLREGDYFLLCTDGILEVFADQELCRLFSGKYSNEEIARQIYEGCKAAAGDNFSMYLLRIQTVPHKIPTAFKPIAAPISPSQQAGSEKNKKTKANENTQTAPKKGFSPKMLVGFLGLLLLLLVAMIALYFHFDNMAAQETAASQPISREEALKQVEALLNQKQQNQADTNNISDTHQVPTKDAKSPAIESVSEQEPDDELVDSEGIEAKEFGVIVKRMRKFSKTDGYKKAENEALYALADNFTKGGKKLSSRQKERIKSVLNTLPKNHVVKYGETLGHIIERYGSSRATLKRLNPNTNLDKLRAGQAILYQ